MATAIATIVLNERMRSAIQDRQDQNLTTIPARKISGVDGLIPSRGLDWKYPGRQFCSRHAQRSQVAFATGDDN
jgi:hypothetical protein